MVGVVACCLVGKDMREVIEDAGEKLADGEI